MRLAVLLDTIGQGLHAPVFDLLELAAETLDDLLVGVGQGLHLLGGDVLTRQVDVLVESHARAFLFNHSPRREALRASERPDE